MSAFIKSFLLINIFFRRFLILFHLASFYGDGLLLHSNALNGGNHLFLFLNLYWSIFVDGIIHLYFVINVKYSGNKTVNIGTHHVIIRLLATVTCKSDEVYQFLIKALVDVSQLLLYSREIVRRLANIIKLVERVNNHELRLIWKMLQFVRDGCFLVLVIGGTSLVVDQSLQ